MHFMIPALILASPAAAHPAALPHGHAADWSVPVALGLIAVAAMAARRQTTRVSK